MEVLQGPVAWIFAKEDNISTCIKSFVDFEKTLKGDQRDAVAQLPFITGRAESIL